ncbi:Flavodoxin [Spironucleus salmonicida]|uniref:Flavodoxin n=1 Tax=Spironucleus salmonicida TaxID=348837 RepID=V6M177_9EUKA|nr:Flavodoxin [Spironucleus salmonicida]|eukprot:EST46929.1 Flavodoxin [Spironucleus salmonicida]
MSISIIFASESATTCSVANLAFHILEKKGIQSTIAQADQATPDMFKQTFMYFTSSYCVGDHPNVAIVNNEFFAHQKEFQEAVKGQKFAVYGLGSKSFKTYNAAAEKAEQVFSAAGGIKIIDTMKIDTTQGSGEDPEELVHEFIDKFINSM